MQVNRMFAEAIFAIERKPNDFIWIQDYHLTLVCQHLREKEDPDNPLKVGFFLHTPFELDKNFVYNYAKHGIVVNLFRAVIEGMLHCNKVGFQTHKDRNNFIELVNYIYGSEEGGSEEPGHLIKIEIDGITPVGGCILGVYPASFETKKFVKLANKKEMKAQAKEFRNDRECHLLVTEINNKYGQSNYKPIVFSTDSVNRDELIIRYLAMDIGIVTPFKDGMNLVAKEMIISNPKASLILSEGAGTHHQLSENELNDTYHLVKGNDDYEHFLDDFVDVLYNAATLDEAIRNERGLRLSNFLIKYDAIKWGKDFVNEKYED
uniref:Uncharacterized protein n=1 Tax=Meloidogyne enterolobii TaxID=390850 RepID=A0A6V7UH16_MELEN|nr:unnamed protein product [Meloidogyne enterolobii]